MDFYFGAHIYNANKQLTAWTNHYFAFKMAQNYVKNHKTILFLHIKKI